MVAVWRRKPTAGLVHHSDSAGLSIRRSPWASGSKRWSRRPFGGKDGLLGARWTTLPPRRVPCLRANASSSSITGAHHQRGRKERRLLRVSLEAFYNRRRLHSSLGCVSLESYEDLMTKEKVTIA